MSSIGRYIRQWREQRGIKAAELARRLGKSKSYISLLEKGKYKSISVDMSKKLAEVLQIPIEEILNIQGEKISDQKYRPVSIMSEIQARMPTEIPLFKRLNEDNIGYVYLYIEGKYNSLKALIVDEIKNRPQEIADGAIVVLDPITKPTGGDMVVIEQKPGNYEIFQINKEQAEKLNPAIFRGTVLASLSHYNDKVKFYLS